MILVLFLIVSVATGNQVIAEVTDSLYSEIDDKGNFIDGNRTPLQYDKPIIRPSYQGTSILDDYIGPEGKFQGYYQDKPGTGEEYDYGQRYTIGSKMVIKNVGFYQGKPLALTISFASKGTTWYEKVTITREGGININPFSQGLRFRLVYDDGKYNVPVEGVYVELPVLSQLTAYNTSSKSFSRVTVPTSNLVRIVKNTDVTKQTKMATMRQSSTFYDDQGKYYFANGLVTEYQFYQDRANVKQVEQTYIFDNKEPLNLVETRTLNYINPTTLFKSDMKTPGEINYLPPRTNGSVNSSRFEANFDLTQAVNDGFEQYFPESLSLVMADTEHKFNALNIASLKFTDKKGQDISHYFETIQTDDHQLEFKIAKANLMALKSNQINVTMSADNLNSEEVIKGYDSKEKVYYVPMTFYNYKIYQGKKTESEKMVANAMITPDVYAEAVEGIEVEQYSLGSDLDPNDLLKNVATTIPGDKLTIELEDSSLVFDTVKTYQVGVKVTSDYTGEGKVIKVPVEVTPAVIVTKAFFDNQSWLIDEINRQFLGQNKKIDVNLYMTDLLRVTKIMDTTVSTPFTGQYIPKNIQALKNLEWLELGNKKLAGSLPTELGNLKKLSKLAVSGNTFSGGIPVSLGELTNLKSLILDHNGLSGKMPVTLGSLDKLVELKLNNNQLVGEVVPFPASQLSQYDISMNQVTYDDTLPPSFISKSTDYGNTLIVKNHSNNGAAYGMWALTGIKELAILKAGTQIKPFDSKDSGYFDLKLLLSGGTSTQDIYAEHNFTITRKKTGNVIYEGIADPKVAFTMDPDESVEIVMDGATKNPNNRFTIAGKKRELKVVDIPKNMSLTLEVGNLGQKPVSITSKDSLTIFDNRLESHWKLRLKPSALTNAKNQMSGSYIYNNKANKSITVPANQFKEIEEGDSEPLVETIPLSKGWSQTKGLMFKQDSTANFKGTYQGKLEWQLVDAPSG